MNKYAINSGILLNLLKYAKNVCDEYCIVSNETGWSIKLVDPAHVVMLELEISQATFESFSYVPDTDNKLIGIDGGRLIEITTALRRLYKGSAHSVIDLATDYEKHRLVVDMHDAHRETVMREGLIKSWVIPKIAELTNMVHIKDVDMKCIINCVKHIRTFSNNMVLCIEKIGKDNILVISAENETDSFRMPVAFVSRNIEHVGIRSMYSLDMWHDTFRGISPKRVDLFLGSDFPVELRWKMQDDNISCKWFCAPRIEND